MSPQQVIKNFMHCLDVHGFRPTGSDYDSQSQLGIRILNQAVSKTSHFKSAADVITNMVNDCQYYNNISSSEGYKTFLKTKCGIDLENVDTGAISGSDANIDEMGFNEGIEKGYGNIVPEYGNYYEIMTTASQYIETGNNGWIVKALSGNDTIVSSGEDSICTGSGDNFITIKGAAATIDLATGHNDIFIENSVKSVILFNYDEAKDTLHVDNDDILDVVKFKDNSEKEGTFTSINDPASYMDSNEKVIGLDNYFNISGITQYTGSESIEVHLDDAIDPSNPSPIGCFVKTSSNSAEFVNTNESAKNNGKIVGHVASIYPQLMSFSFKGLKFNVTDRLLIDGSTRSVLKTFSTFSDVGSDTTNTFKNTYKDKQTVPEFTDTDTGNEYERYTVAAIYKWWLKESLKLAETNYEYSFENPDANVLTIDLHFKKIIGGSGALAAVAYNYYPSTGEAVILTLEVNKDFYETFTNVRDTNGDIMDVTGFYFDRTIAHEFTHAIMSVKINYFDYLPKFITEGTAELAHGIDDKRTSSIINLAKNPETLRNSVNLTLHGKYDQYDPYAGGYIFLRYFAKQAALNSVGKLFPCQIVTTVNLNNKNDTNYYIDGTIAEPVATTTVDKFIVGTASDGLYQPADNFRQCIDIKNDNNWDIYIDTPENSIFAGNSNTNIEIAGGDNQYIQCGNGNNNITINANDNELDLGDGNNCVTIIGGDRQYIEFGNGDNTLCFYYRADDTYKDSFANLGSGNDIVTIIGANHTVHMDGGDNFIRIYGDNNSLFSGTGDDTINQYTDSAGNNKYLFSLDKRMGDNVIKNFMANDLIIIDDQYTAEFSDEKFLDVMDNGKLIGTVKSGNITIKSHYSDNMGIINFMTCKNNDFDRDKNVIFRTLNDEEPDDEEEYEDYESDILNITYTCNKKQEDYESDILNITYTCDKKQEDYELDILNITYTCNQKQNNSKIDILTIDYTCNQKQNLLNNKNILNIEYDIQPDNIDDNKFIYTNNDLINIRYNIGDTEDEDDGGDNFNVDAFDKKIILTIRFEILGEDEDEDEDEAEILIFGVSFS